MSVDRFLPVTQGSVSMDELPTRSYGELLKFSSMAISGSPCSITFNLDWRKAFIEAKLFL